MAVIPEAPPGESAEGLKASNDPASAIGQDFDNDVRVVLFVKLREGNTPPRHVPAKIMQVSDIPRTKSGKIVELAVRDIVHGRSVRSLEALANPETLLLYKDIPELKL